MPTLHRIHRLAHKTHKSKPIFASLEGGGEGRMERQLEKG